MTRREFLWDASGASVMLAAAAPAPLAVPVRVVRDARAELGAGQMRWFWDSVWAEASRDFTSGGVRLEATRADGEVWRPEFREPMVRGIEQGTINLVVTNRIPMEWDKGLALGGVTTRYRGHDLCMVALSRAHGNQIPFLSVNSVVHELLHVLLHDVLEARPKGLRGEAREFRVDYYATRLWLFGDGQFIRESAKGYLAQMCA